MKIQTEPFRKISRRHAAENLAHALDLSAEARAFLLPTWPAGLSVRFWSMRVRSATRFASSPSHCRFARASGGPASVASRATSPSPPRSTAHCLERAAPGFMSLPTPSPLLHGGGRSGELRRARRPTRRWPRSGPAAAWLRRTCQTPCRIRAPSDRSASERSVLLAITSGDPKLLNEQFEDGNRAWRGHRKRRQRTPRRTTVAIEVADREAACV